MMTKSVMLDWRSMIILASYGELDRSVPRGESRAFNSMSRQSSFSFEWLVELTTQDVESGVDGAGFLDNPVNGQALEGHRPVGVI